MLYEEIAQSVFQMRNFFDELSLFDTDCICRYCEIINPDTYSFTADEIIGKHLFEIFPSSNEANSEVYSVVKTGQPIIGYEENGVTYKGDHVKGYSSVFPLYHKKKLIGAALALKFIGAEYPKEYISVQDFSSRRSKGAENYTIDDIITIDPDMEKLKRKILKVRDMDSSVLIEGSTGTGKELVAQSLHYSSNRAAMPFISLNCSAIPENLLESTLFGTEKGSYTGAVSRKGLIELADKGTLFLDEINSLDIALQAKLLKAIEEKAVLHLGGHQPIHVDVRIIAAINEDPFEAINAGHLRSDLFYRLNVISFKLPLLKNRQGDIDHLTAFYINQFNKNFDRHLQGLSEEALRLFHSHSWPGNVRELRNMLEGAFAIAESSYITPEDLPPYMQNIGTLETEISNQTTPTYQQQLTAFERQLLQKTLNAYPTKTEAAKALGITKQALNYKLTSLGLK